MNRPIPVCPFDPPLLFRLGARRAVLLTDDPSKVPIVRSDADSHGIDLFCVWVKTPVELADVSFSPDWGDTPVALETTGPGSLRQVLKLLPIIDKLNIRFYLPGITRQDMVDIRILSSLGYPCCIADYQDKAEPDWESLYELAVYAAYPLAPHGDIDPFSYILRRHGGGGPLDLRALHFDDPLKFIHVDGDGNLSVSHKGVPGGIELGLPVERFDEALNSQAYIEAANSWKSFFVEPGACARCEAWRVCMGAFSRAGSKECSKIFKEVLEAAERAGASGMAAQKWRH